MSLRAKRGNLPEGERRKRTRASQMPAAALRREIPRERNGNNRTRKPRILARAGSAPFAVKHYAAGRWRPALPTASPRIGYAVISTEAVAKWRPPRDKRYRSNTKTPNTRPRRLTVEKSPTAETARRISAPAHSPAVAHRREILRVIKTLPLEHEYTEYSPAVAHRLARAGSAPCPQRLTAFRSLFYHKTN